MPSNRETERKWARSVSLGRTPGPQHRPAWWLIAWPLESGRASLRSSTSSAPTPGLLTHLAACSAECQPQGLGGEKGATSCGMLACTCCGHTWHSPVAASEEGMRAVLPCVHCAI